MFNYFDMFLLFFITGVFVGFNHHRQSCVLGVAILFDETQESFAWLFKISLSCMNGKALVTIFTDQDPTIAGGIRVSLPNTYHALCTWHILENANKKLGRLEHGGLYFFLNCCV